MGNSKIKNIPLEHFKSIVLPNVQNQDILNIYLFYREDKSVEKKEFKQALKDLDLKLMLKKLFEISSLEEEEFVKNNSSNKIDKKENSIKNKSREYSSNMADLKKRIFEFKLEELSEEEILEMKWLLYDCVNSSGNKIVDLENTNILKEAENGTLYVYFTDSRLRDSIEKLQKNGYNFAFYENYLGSKKYLKLFSNDGKFRKMHEYVYNDGKIKVNKEYIDHIQRPPEYFFDFNCLSNTIISFQSEKEKIKNVIYSRIIECWRNRLYSKMTDAQFNNCRYNLKIIDEKLNKDEKQKIIENSPIKWIYPHRDLQSSKILYVTFYFPKSQYLKVNGRDELITLLSIKYNNVDYNKIIKELYQYVCNTEDIDGMIKNLFKYIKGKNILYMTEDKNNITKRAIVETHDFFDTKRYIELCNEIENYQ